MIIVVTADELSKLFSISLCINYILVVLKIDNHDKSRRVSQIYLSRTSWSLFILNKVDLTSRRSMLNFVSREQFEAAFYLSKLSLHYVNHLRSSPPMPESVEDMMASKSLADPRFMYLVFEEERIVIVSI